MFTLALQKKLSYVEFLKSTLLDTDYAVCCGVLQTESPENHFGRITGESTHKIGRSLQFFRRKRMETADSKAILHTLAFLETL